jgi:predicted transcriptional regulator
LDERAPSRRSRECRPILDGVLPLTIWRERVGLSQAALADAAGVNASYLNEIEQGKSPAASLQFATWP